MSLYTVYPPQKDPPAPVYARAYENSAATSKSLTVANLLSPELGNRSSSRLPSAPLLARRTPSPTQSSAASSSRAARPATGSTNSVALPSTRCRGRCRNTTSTQKSPESTPDHDSVAAAVSHKHHSISRVGAGLIQFVHSRTCSLVADVIPNKFLFWPFPRQVFFRHVHICICMQI